MWSKQNKEKEEKKVVRTTTTQSLYVTQTQTSQTVTHHQIVRTRNASEGGLGSSSSLPKLETNFLTLPSSSAARSTSASNLRASLDAKPVNLNYQSPYRNSTAYGSFQHPKPISSIQPIKSSILQPPKVSSTQPIKPGTSTSTGTAYRSALPATVQPLPKVPTPSKEITVKKTGKFYDNQGGLPTYQTHSKNRGEVLIINNIMFKEKGYRHGAEVDHKNLKSLFKHMGFNVSVKQDLKSSSMESQVKEFSRKSSLKSADIAILVVMSHGTKNPTLGGTEVFGLDEQGVLVDNLIHYFNENDCKYMADKPKIFIFQCCRGDNEQFVRSDATAIPPKAAPVKDALIAYSSLPGFVSHRDPEYGTWYVSTLCDVFSRHAHEYHVEDLLKIVDVELGNLAKNVRQTTHYENRGFKRCYLHPK